MNFVMHMEHWLEFICLSSVTLLGPAHVVNLLLVALTRRSTASRFSSDMVSGKTDEFVGSLLITWKHVSTTTRPVLPRPSDAHLETCDEWLIVQFATCRSLELRGTPRGA